MERQRLDHVSRPLPRGIRAQGDLRRAREREPVTLGTMGEALLKPGCVSPYYVKPDQAGRVVHPDTVGAIRISCGKCRNCAVVRKQMLIGRMAAEAATSEKTLLLTLTYAPNEDGSDPEAARVLQKPDAQKFRKTMTKRYGRLQYVIAGEYGARRQRAHWHALVFFRPGQKRPDWASLPDRVRHDHWMACQLGQITKDGFFVSCGVPVAASGRGEKLSFRAYIPEWSHGHVDVKAPDFGAFGYVAKYLLKDSHRSTLDVRAGMIEQTASVRSRGLGLTFIQELGARMAREMVAPRDALYSVPGGVYKRGPREGKHIRFTMTRAMRREYFDAFLREVAPLVMAGKRKLEMSEALLSHLDQQAKIDPSATAQRLARSLLGAAQFNAAWLPSFRTALPVRRAITTPDGAVCFRDPALRWWLAWYHCDHRAGDPPAILHPLPPGWRALRCAVQRSGAEALGGLSPDYTLTPDQRVTLSKAQRERLHYLAAKRRGSLTAAQADEFRRLAAIDRQSVLVERTVAWRGQNNPGMADCSSDTLLAFVDQGEPVGDVGIAARLRFLPEARDALRERELSLLLDAATPSPQELANRGVRSVGLPVGTPDPDAPGFGPEHFPLWQVYAAGEMPGPITRKLTAKRATKHDRAWFGDPEPPTCCEYCDNTGFIQAFGQDVPCPSCMAQVPAPPYRMVPGGLADRALQVMHRKRSHRSVRGKASDTAADEASRQFWRDYYASFSSSS